MQLKIDIKPIVIEATHKAILLQKIKGSWFVWSGGGFGYGLSGFTTKNEVVRVYNLQKQKRKFKQVTDKKKLNKGIKKVRIREAKWTAWCYDIPVQLLHTAGLQVKQGARTFSIARKYY